MQEFDVSIENMVKYCVCICLQIDNCNLIEFAKCCKEEVVLYVLT